MKKNAYRAKNINLISQEQLKEKLPRGRAIVAVDVAKHLFVAGISGADGKVVQYLRFTHPVQTRQFLDLLEAINGWTSLDVVMEPTGTYGDALRGQLLSRGIPCFAVSPKRCHDAAEIFDGVPSLHDAKATSILARLHTQGLSKPWPEDDQVRRELRAAIARREIYAAPLHSHQGRLEALLSRQWPEFCEYLNPNKRKTPLALLAEYPSPALVAQNPEAAAKLMMSYSRGKLSSETITKVVASARTSLGVRMNEQECRLLSELAQQMLNLWREVNRIDKEIASLARSNTETMRLAPTLGVVTAAVLVALLGPVTTYESAGAYVKAIGINLKEHSSGKSKKVGTGLHITKRGPGLARKYLFLATLRLIQRDPICRAWYQSRRSYGHGEKLKAVVALMRKLARGLWHVGRGEPFDASKLFDTSRLALLETQQVANA